MAKQAHADLKEMSENKLLLMLNMEIATQSQKIPTSK